MQVLVVEDDPKVAGAVRAGLAAEGYGVAVSRTGEDGYFRATTEPFDIVVLDLGLPGRSGLEVLHGLRSRLRLRIADLDIDLLARRVTRGGVPVELSVREFDLLAYLLRHQGQIVSREMLVRDVWHEPGRGTPLDNVIDVHIARLRKKVDQEQSRRLIHTMRGVGFLVRDV
jgi:two-component system copper resistance phosphate regulon response regulator CusR